MSTVTLASIVVAGALAVAVSAVPLPAQQAPKPAAGNRELNLTAKSANVKEPGRPVTIKVLRWSTDEERSAIAATLKPAPAPPPPPATPTGGDAAAGGNAAAGARGAAGGRGAAGRGGRGGRGRGDAAEPLTPIAALAAALGKAPTLGYIWTTDVTGYSIKYAFRSPLPDKSERIIVITDRRLGSSTPGWEPVPAVSDLDYDFTLIEIRLDPKGTGEGKTSLTTKVVLEAEANTPALDNYASAPATLQNVKR